MLEKLFICNCGIYDVLCCFAYDHRLPLQNLFDKKRNRKTSVSSIIMFYIWSFKKFSTSTSDGIEVEAPLFITESADAALEILSASCGE